MPGATILEQVKENSLVGHLGDVTLTVEERHHVEQLAEKLEHVRCRICGECEPCPIGIPIGLTLGTDILYDDYRTMGPEAFKAFP
ncbi:MAG: hypothetical protein QW057_06380 [Candidatus Bathyarchaeia archaeon]